MPFNGASISRLTGRRILRMILSVCAVRLFRAGRDAARAIDARLREAAGDAPWEAPAPRAIEIPLAIDEGAADRSQAAMPVLDPARRVSDFGEVELGFDRQTAIAEAGRCMRCDLSLDEAEESAGAGDAAGTGA